MRVQREGRSPTPWVWEIHRDDGSGPLRRASRGYRSAEEAWEAGQDALAALARGAGPSP